MSLTRLLCGAVAALSCLPALANGPLDGIYNLGGTKEYFSIHQSGSSLIVGYFTTIPASGVTFFLGDGQQFPPPRIDYWDLYSGSLSTSNSADVIGEIAYGACKSTINVTFYSTGIDVTQKFIETTSVGFNNNINCPRYQDFLVSRRGLTQFWTKVY